MSCHSSWSPAHMGCRTQSPMPAASWIEQAAEYRHTIVIGQTEPSNCAVRADQRSSPAVTNHTQLSDRRIGSWVAPVYLAPTVRVWHGSSGTVKLGDSPRQRRSVFSLHLLDYREVNGPRQLAGVSSDVVVTRPEAGLRSATRVRNRGFRRRSPGRCGIRFKGGK